MHKFLFLFESTSIQRNIFFYNFLPITENNIKELVVNDDTYFHKKMLSISEAYSTYSEKNNFLKNIKYNFSFQHKDIEVDTVVFSGDISEKRVDEVTKKIKRNYDAIFIFYFNTSTKPISDKYNNIYVECDEIPTEISNIKQILKSPQNKFITSGIFDDFSHDRYYYNHKLAFGYFYYLLGFYHLGFDNINIEKENLLGSYLKKGYRAQRDELYDRVVEKFDNKDKIKNYSFKFDNNISMALDLKFYFGWMKNHITSFTDYMRSLFILNFESDGPDEPNNHHITEKTVKSILFSKLNIPSILFAHQEILLKLKEDGFWFLNFDFIDFDKLKKWQESDDEREGAVIVDNSVLKSADFILELDKKFKGNKKEIENYIVENYSDKLQNNYKLFKNILNDIDIKEEVFNTITKNYKKWHNQNTHLI